MTEQILLEKFALLHLWIENNDDEEDKAEKPNFFLVMRGAEVGAIEEEAIAGERERERERRLKKSVYEK